MSNLNYKQQRLNAFDKQIPIGNQLDAILKAFDMVLQIGGELPYELIDVIEKWKDIKEKYPKN